MIELKNVEKSIKEKVVLNDINLKLDQGDCVLVRGHNGCGKTMLLRLICGLIKPTKGTLNCDQKYSYGVIIENPSFFMNESALYNLKYLASINKSIDDNTIDTYLKKLNLYEDRKTKVRKYSLGMKQRLAICQAFMEDPDVILLDEPFNALDDDNLEIVYNLIEEFKNKGKIIVVAAHGEINKSIFNKTIKMSNGKIVEEKALA